ncbi:unnamed protein product [Moneuplotes crassus]|uniref:Uncharacterized protein n=1 Tax=Euplotes crassus TaxID=5936 RepID=A0AAD2DAM7_EUPCR|nr:unnamed protein product [Moneuplotes crassus]
MPYLMMKTITLCARDLIQISQSVDHQVSAEAVPLQFGQACLIYIKLALPAVGGMLLMRGPEVVDYVVAGHLGDPAFVAGFGLALVSMSVMVVSLSIGLSGGVETLCSQAFGRNEDAQAGEYYRRAQLIMTALFIPQAILLCFAPELLIMTGQPEKASYLAGDYIKICMPGIWCYCQTELLRRFLGAQGVFKIIMNFQILNFFLHFLWIYIFVYTLDLSYSGIAYATLMTYMLNYICPVLYISLFSTNVRADSWGCISRSTFSGLLQYLEYGLPSMTMNVAEVWAFEVVVIMGGYFGEENLAAFVTTFNVMITLYMVALGFQFSANTVVGNCLGAGQAQKAKMFVNVTLATAVLLCVGHAIVVLTCKDYIAAMLVTGDGLRKKCSKMLALFVFLGFGKYIQAISQGVIKAMGFQKYATVICLVGYWIVSLPITYFFSFHLGYGVEALCICCSIGMIFAGICSTILIYRTDLDKLCKDIDLVMKRESKNQATS